MATMNAVIKGLTILAKPSPKAGDCYNISAEHDIIYAGPSEADKVPEADRKKLEDLGWFLDVHVDSWAVFV